MSNDRLFSSHNLTSLVGKRLDRRSIEKVRDIEPEIIPRDWLPASSQIDAIESPVLT